MTKTTQIALPEAVTQIEAHESRSQRYKFISTLDVITLAEKHGWKVATAVEGKTRREGQKGYNKHIVIMEKEKFSKKDGRIQLVIRNSHNGSSGINIFLGYMRIVCANQLYAKKLGKGMNLSVRHSQNGYDQLVEFLGNFDKAVNQFGRKIKKANEKVLSPSQVRVFAQKALSLRIDQELITPEVIDQAVEAVRVEDSENTAWNVMNRIQEKFILGGLHIYNPEKGKMKRLRKIRAIDTQVNLNSQLMDLALA
jgi:hypothetical protein